MQRLALLIFIPAALALAGVASADEKPVMFTEPVEEVFENPCTGETIVLTGEMLVMIHALDDGGGGYHEKFTLVPQGITAVGASGTQYRSIGAHSDYFGTGPGRASTFSFTVTFLAVSEGGRDNFVAKATIHVTENANGEPTAAVDELRVECRG